MKQFPVARACSALEKRFGRPIVRRQKPLDSLVAVIISQNTSDRNSIPAFRALKKRFPKWEQLLQAGEEEIAGIIHSAGLANLKAARIKHVLSEISKIGGAGRKLSLGFVGRLSKQDAMQFFLSLKGVGPKSAAIVVNFAFGKPSFPVDTHIYRICRRLGVVPLKFSREKAQQLLDGLVPDAQKTSCHINLITLGRTICKPSRPLCSNCPLKGICRKVGVAVSQQG